MDLTESRLSFGTDTGAFVRKPIHTQVVWGLKSSLQKPLPQWTLEKHCLQLGDDSTIVWSEDLPDEKACRWVGWCFRLPYKCSLTRCCQQGWVRPIRLLYECRKWLYNGSSFPESCQADSVQKDKPRTALIRPQGWSDVTFLNSSISTRGLRSDDVL